MGADQADAGFHQTVDMIERIEHLKMRIQRNRGRFCDLFDECSPETDAADEIAVIDVEMDMFKAFRLLQHLPQAKQIGGLDRRTYGTPRSSPSPASRSTAFRAAS